MYLSRNERNYSSHFRLLFVKDLIFKYLLCPNLYFEYTETSQQRTSQIADMPWIADKTFTIVTVFFKLLSNRGHLSIKDEFFKNPRWPLFRGFTVLQLRKLLQLLKAFEKPLISRRWFFCTLTDLYFFCLHAMVFSLMNPQQNLTKITTCT